LDLKAVKQFMNLYLEGRLFHNFGEIAEKALSPNVDVLVLGTNSKFFQEDLRVLLFTSLGIISEI
jgi:hypothetical protein